MLTVGSQMWLMSMIVGYVYLGSHPLAIIVSGVTSAEAKTIQLNLIGAVADVYHN